MASTTHTTPSRTTPPARRWTAREIEDEIVSLLAALLRKDPAGLRRELEEKGGALPVDSLDLLDVLADFHQRTGIRKIPKKKLTQRVMRSVKEFSTFVAREAQSQ